MKETILKREDMSSIEQAILYLAEMMENENHDQYAITKDVMDILGYKKVNLGIIN